MCVFGIFTTSDGGRNNCRLVVRTIDQNVALRLRLLTHQDRAVGTGCTPEENVLGSTLIVVFVEGNIPHIKPSPLWQGNYEKHAANPGGVLAHAGENGTFLESSLFC